MDRIKSSGSVAPGLEGKTGPSFSSEEKKEGLEIIRRVDPLLKDIIWEEWLKTRSSSFIKPRQVYDERGGAAQNGERAELLPIAKIAREKSRIKELKGKWKIDPNKEYANFTERMVVVFASKLQWLGKDTGVRLTDEIDDINRATDFSAHFKRIIEGKIVLQNAGFDTTSEAYYGFQKVANAMRFINYGTLGELLIAQSTAEETGKEMKGREELLPHFVFVISHKRTAEIAKLIDNKEWEKLATHPLQVELLEQALVQARAYHAYAKHITYAERDYKNSPIPKLSTRIVRDDQLRETVLDVLDRCVKLFQNALKEREELITRNKKGSNEQTRNMLQAYVPDTEHLNFAALFKKEGRQQFNRFRAFLTVMPPVKTNSETGKKEPIKVRVKGREEQLKRRFTNLVRQPEDNKDSGETVA